MPQDLHGLIDGAADLLRDHFLGGVTVRQQALAACSDDVLRLAAALADTFRSHGKVLLCGNGGSAADCQHIAGELVCTLNHDHPRPGLAAIALTTNTSILTASANDSGYQTIFERQVQALGNSGDLLVGITTSGNSPNVVRALEFAAAHGIHTAALTGSPGGRAAEIAEIAIRVPSANVQHIQEVHIAIGHVLCDLIERTLFPAQG